MYPVGDFGGLFFVVSVLWIGILSFFVWQNNVFLKRLFPKKGESLKTKLEEVLVEVGKLEEFKKQSLGYIQKVSLVRYNPYKDTGGDQSFTIALLDGKDDGVVITSLHNRAGTRIFAKSVLKGGEDKFEFSKEEKEVIQSCQKY